MEVTKKPKIKSIPYEEFTDNETLENWFGNLMSEAPMSPLAYWTTSSTGDAATHVASYVCNQLLRYRIHGPRRSPLRYGALRVRGSRASPRQADMIWFAEQ